MKLEREFNELTDLIIDEGYGMTEAGPLIATNQIAPGMNRPGSVTDVDGLDVD